MKDWSEMSEEEKLVAYHEYMTPEKIAELDYICAEIDDPRRYVIQGLMGWYYNVEMDMWGGRELATEFKVRDHADAIMELLAFRSRHQGPDLYITEVEKTK